MAGINSNFSVDYSSLFNNTVGNQYSSASLYNLQQSLSSNSYFNYGVNNSSMSQAQADKIVDLKSGASTLQNALSSLMNKKNDGGSIFGEYKAVSSNTDALTATYNNNISKYSSEALQAKRDPDYKPSAPEELSVKAIQLAGTQKNTGLSLDTNGMELEANKTYRFEISDGDKTTTVSFVTEAGDTNESVMKKIAAAVNDKNIGVNASVSTNDVTGKSSLVLESRQTGLKEGAERSFEIRDVSGYDAVSKLGLDNVSQEAQNAKFFIAKKDGSAELKESMSNTVALTDRTTVTFKKTTEDYVDIGYDRDTLGGINAVREVVNGFNALFDAAATGSTIQSARLAGQLQSLFDTYSKSLSDVGITKDADGYLVINEDKMKEAAESGALENVFSSDDKATNYGFAKRLQNIANTVADNPNQYVTGKTSAQDAEAAGYWDEADAVGTTNYSKLFFNLQKYENMGALFNSMF